MSREGKIHAIAWELAEKYEGSKKYEGLCFHDIRMLLEERLSNKSDSYIDRLAEKLKIA